MKRSDKPAIVESLSKEAKEAKSLVIVDYQGLSVRDLSALRNKIREAGGRMLVVKNTLLSRALQKAGNNKGLPRDEVLRGPTAVVFANDDEIAPLQVIGKFIKEMNLPKLKFGIFDSKIIDSAQLKSLSTSPGKATLIGQLLGTIAAPAYSLLGTLQANSQQLVYILRAKSEAQE